MPHTPEDLHRLVTSRADGRCEYCGLAQAGQEAAFHIDHIQPRAEDGPTIEGNLALACVSCSLRKCARVDAADPLTGQSARLFNPRADQWLEHFLWKGVSVEGITPVGRATVAALDMNRPMILAIRTEEMERGRHPPRYSPG
jgi:hypothetical protein